MKRSLFVILGLVLVIATAAQVRAMRSSSGKGPAPAAQPSSPVISAEGRLVAYPGAEVTVGTDVAGTLETLSVHEKDSVHRGDVLAVIRANDSRAALNEARARVGEADADIRLYEVERKRAEHLWRDAVGSKQAWEKSERDLDSARARRASSVAEVGRLQAVMDKTVIRSPIDGVVTARFVQGGETIDRGAFIVSIADLSRTRIEAEVDEFDAGRVKAGQNVMVSAEGFEGQHWKGRIEEIPDVVTSRRLKPQDNAKPTDTRVLLVKVAMSEATPLRLGQRVEVAIAHDGPR